ncbi:Sodium-coupled monocarboxylate transporter 1, partial [Operophtera brumata]
GGMKAVIMTDSFQSAVLIGSLAAVLAMGAAQVGGMDYVWDYARHTDRLHFFDMNPDPTVRHSFWSVVVGGTVYWTSMFCANQASVQKYLSMERIGQVRVALWISAFGLIAVYSVNFITGAVLALHYADCDPIQNGDITGSDRLLPLYVVRELGHARGVPGFFVAGIFAASLGTVASALNSLAAVACQDLAKGLLGITLPEDKGALIARWVCVACGAISFALVFVVEHLGPVLQLALSFNGMAGGVSLGLGAHDEAVFWLFRVSYLWYSGMGCGATLLVGLVVSFVTGATDPALVPIDLISPPVVKLLNSLPNRFKKHLRVPTRLGSERRRSSSVRPPSMADDKDTRRRRRLSELAGGVFYSDESNLTRGFDNPALDSLDPEKPPPEDYSTDTCIKLKHTSINSH